MVDAAQPIGVFDSGVGGLSVLREIRAQLPHEDALYIADQSFAPYGSRTLEEVRSRSIEVSRQLLQMGAKLIVVACNSASAAALHELRAEFPDVPFVGMEPALKPAAEHTDRGVIGVLATSATFQGKLYASVLDRHASDVQVHQVAGERLATLVEEGRFEEAKSDLESLLRPMLTAGIDTLVLGCTHYPFLDRQLRDVVGPDVRLVDPAPAIARQTGRMLDELDLRNDAGGDVGFFTTSDPDRFGAQLRMLIDIDAVPQHIDIAAP